MDKHPAIASRIIVEALDTNSDGDPTPAPINLSEGNPARCDFARIVWPKPVNDIDLQAWAPDPQGSHAARRALACTITQAGRATLAEQLFLCANSSDALSMLFKMACEPGDTIGVGTPGYPLVRHIAELEGLRWATFASGPAHTGYAIDLNDIARLIDNGIKALIIIAPNNPTGACPSPNEVDALAHMCNARGVLLIVDEVFADYYHDEPFTRFINLRGFARAVAVGGISKSVLLPGLKLGWMAVYGEPSFITMASAALRWIGDTYLNVAMPVQTMLPHILALAPHVRQNVRARIAINKQHVFDVADRSRSLWVMPCTCGWYAIVKVLRKRQGKMSSCEVLSYECALRRYVAEVAGVDILMGHMFDLNWGPAMITSLILPPKTFLDGWQKLARALACDGAPA